MTFKMVKHLLSLHHTVATHRCAEKGATAVEMALLAPVFFTLVMGVVETGLMFTAQQLLENAAFNTTRLAKTGYSATGQTQLQTITQVLNNELQSYGAFIDPNKISMTSTAYTSFANAGSNASGTNGLGTSQEVVVYTITYPWNLITPLIGTYMGTAGVMTLSTHIVVRNEPYG